MNNKKNPKHASLSGPPYYNKTQKHGLETIPRALASNLKIK